MKIRTKLYATFIVSIGLLIILSLSLYVFSLIISSELKRKSLAEEFKESITSVIILAHEYTSLKSVRTERLLEMSTVFSK